MDAASTAQALTTLFGYARDISVVSGILVVAWKARGMWDSVAAFITKVGTFMDTMTAHADTLVSNHLNHLQKSADQMNGKLDAQTELLQEIKDNQ
jgi:hypothetical protein